MPHTWYAHGVSPAVEPVYIRDESVRGVYGWDIPEPPVRVKPTPPDAQKKTKKVYSYRGENFTLGKDGLLEKV